MALEDNTMSLFGILFWRGLASSALSGAAQTNAGAAISSKQFGGQQKRGNNWNYHSELSALAVRLGHKVEELPSLLNVLEQECRLTAAESKEVVVKPCRLALLGRSTMMHYVNEYLCFSYPVMDGFMLADLAKSITNPTALTQLASHFGITDLIRVKPNIPLHANVITQSFCGVLGAIYYDQGPKLARKFVHEVVIPQLSGQDFEQVVKLQHPRLMLNAILKKQNQPKPMARLVNESGRATHFPSFVVGVFSGEKCLGQGTGTSLRRAEEEAMLTALRTHFQKELSAAALPYHKEFSTEELKDMLHPSPILKGRGSRD